MARDGMRAVNQYLADETPSGLWYYLYHYTKDPKYLAMGETFLNDLIKYCRTDAGYTVLRNVVTKEKGDLMHSFFLAETLKYLYLLFAPDALDFDKVVFNTEAHPLRKTW